MQYAELLAIAPITPHVRMPNKGTPATRLYYLHPLLAGPIDAWARQLDRAAAMRFDTVAIAPPFAIWRLRPADGAA